MSYVNWEATLNSPLYLKKTPPSKKNPSPEESRSSRMSMSWIPTFIFVLIHHGIFGIYQDILVEGS